MINSKSGKKMLLVTLFISEEFFSLKTVTCVHFSRRCMYNVVSCNKSFHFTLIPKSLFYWIHVIRESIK